MERFPFSARAEKNSVRGLEWRFEGRDERQSTGCPHS